MAQDVATKYCQLATTTKCPKSCWGPSDPGNIQVLNSYAKCGENEKWNGGCMIKNGTIFTQKGILLKAINLIKNQYLYEAKFVYSYFNLI